ncbi:MAG: hypothetical protein ACYDC1_06130 [Limisphaerales bacterium]
MLIASVEAIAAGDEAVAIPMPPQVDLLQVSAAAAVFLYEARRQRGLASSPLPYRRTGLPALLPAWNRHCHR